MLQVDMLQYSFYAVMHYNYIINILLSTYQHNSDLAQPGAPDPPGSKPARNSAYLFKHVTSLA